MKRSFNVSALWKSLCLHPDGNVNSFQTSSLLLIVLYDLYKLYELFKMRP
jgi:hypothetical protein